MSNCAPGLVVDGVDPGDPEDEVGEDVEGTVLSFFDTQPANPNTTAAESVPTAAAVTRRDGLRCMRMLLTPLRD